MVYMGTYETDMSPSTGDCLIYTDEKTAGWNFNEVVEGRWPQKDGEIAVDEHFVESHGGDVHVGDVIHGGAGSGTRCSGQWNLHSQR